MAEHTLPPDMSSAVDPLVYLADRHQQQVVDGQPRGTCQTCAQPWPCDLSLVVAVLQQQAYQTLAARLLGF